MHHLALPLVDEWADPFGPLSSLVDQRIDERFGRRLDDIHPLNRDADLAGVGERTLRRLLGGPSRIDAAVDDQRVIAAVLQQRLGSRSAHALAMARPVTLLPT